MTVDTNFNYELVIIWDDGTKNITGYKSKAKAEEIESGMKKVFGKQIEWSCVREARGC